MRLAACALALAAGAACDVVGGGEGFVVGRIRVAGCEGDRALDEADYELGADFFAGEPFDDPEEAGTLARDTLALRLQRSGTSADRNDALVIQVGDVAAAASRMGEPLALAPDEDVRAQLALDLSCPDAFPSLAAQGGGCPAEVGRDALCEGDFDAREPYRGRIEEAFPEGSACIVFCALGDGFGDEVAAAFRMRVSDARTGDEGELVGRFRFELARGRAGQFFP